ncbi:MAG: universal stress protein [Gammaproteobacteria bacterium]|nr:universal stress protein [Gammaproteobacteria bacterium]
MTIKTIILPIRESDVADSLMETAICMAIRNNAHLDLLYVQNEPEHLVPFATLGVSTSMRQSIIESASAAAIKQGEDLKQRFQALCERLDMKQSTRCENPGEPSAEFLIRRGIRNELIALYGRLADLIIVPQPLSVSPPPSSFEAALRDTGRPVLMVPRKKILVDAGKTLAIGWNASKEAAQAMAAVMGNLQRADKVYVLESEKRMQNPLNAIEACAYLKCHGVAAEPAAFNVGKQSVGEALLTKANELNCDRLIVGGYSRSKLRNMIMGGVTGHLMANSDIPVILVH